MGPGGRRFESCHPDFKNKIITFSREWLRGGAPPCQGGGRGFESRLALFCFIVSFYWLGLDFIRVPGFFAYNLTWER